MEGAIRLVTRSVAVTLTLMMVASSSGEVSTKSVGNSWDTPTLLTVFVAYNGRAAQSQYSSTLPFKGKETEKQRRTEHANFNRLELLEKRLPSRIIRRRKVDDERLGLYTIGTVTVTATCVDYFIFI